MYINHPVKGMFDVNCQFAIEGRGKRVRVNIYATEEIPAGVELFIEYEIPDKKKKKRYICELYVWVTVHVCMCVCCVYDCVYVCVCVH